VGVNVKPACFFLEVEPKASVEASCPIHVGHGDVHVIERMHAQRAGTAPHQLREGADLRHIFTILAEAIVIQSVRSAQHASL